MVELEIEGIHLDAVSRSPILLLRERDGHRCLPIWIGAPEAAAIALALDGPEPPRPLTHDLLSRVLLTTAEEPPELTITGMEDGVWYGRLDIGDLSFDARPSDLAALAVRLPVSLRCPAELLDEVGVDPDAGPDDEVEQFRKFLDHVSPDDFEV